jgi:hypothetical protein
LNANDEAVFWIVRRSQKNAVLLLHVRDYFAPNTVDEFLLFGAAH